jgi:hypothetical protein
MMNSERILRGVTAGVGCAGGVRIADKRSATPGVAYSADIPDMFCPLCSQRFCLCVGGERTEGI